ncbi:MAG: hypothetical protein GX060_04170 [Firmicutes bacterium]|nr:hypothetical protein [Bacillota bacterium]
MRVGIPRALTYHDYFPLWETFFHNLGCEVVTSPPTTPEIANAGVTLAGDDVCYPVKVMYGHVAELANRVDVIYVPRLFSTAGGTCECPKLIGLADMLRHSIPRLPPLISPYVNLRRGKRGLWRAIYATAAPITRNPRRIFRAYQAGKKELIAYQRRYQTGLLPNESKSPAADKGQLAIIGHSYNIYDGYVNLRLVERLLARGYRVLTPQMLSKRALAEANKILRKPLFWSAGRTVFGAGAYYARRPDVAGIIHLASFGCGLESLLIDLVQRVANAHGKPLLLLTMDEHTGAAGVETRLEAFLDMLAWKEDVACV